MAAKMPRGFPTYLAPRRCARGCLMHAVTEKIMAFGWGKIPGYHVTTVFSTSFLTMFFGDFGGLLQTTSLKKSPFSRFRQSEMVRCWALRMVRMVYGRPALSWYGRSEHATTWHPTTKAWTSRSNTGWCFIACLIKMISMLNIKYINEYEQK